MDEGHSGDPGATADGRMAATVAHPDEVEQQAQYRALIEMAADGVWVVDTTGQLLLVNAAYARRSGYSREELLAMSVGDLDVQESPDEIQAHMKRVREQGSDLFETRHRSRDGEIWSVEVSVSYSVAAGNKFCCFLRDIGERKRAEELSLALSTDADQVMRFQVASQTVAAIAHDLNQPLNAIASYSEAALRLLRAGDGQSQKLIHALESNIQQVQRAGRVVRELLAFVSHGQVETSAVDLNELVQSALRRTAGGGRSTFTARLDLAPDLPPVSANRAQVDKVLRNLVRNSLEAMQASGMEAKDVTVTVRTSADGRMAQVTVEDMGPGIAPDVIHRVFDPFFTTKPRGLGMGLAICRAIIEAHRGRLWVESLPGQGARFHFTLPFAS